jgi:ferredoxin/flavodoxin---NADP+ reductase
MSTVLQELHTDAKVYDITVVGGGPVGLFTAFYAGIRNASTKIIDSLPQLGGQLAALYPEKYIYDVAGFPKVTARELVDRLIEQMSRFSPTVVTGEQVMNVEKQDDGVFRLTTTKGIHYSKTIILAGGIGAFTPKTLPAENAELFEEKGIYYFIDDLEKFRGKKCLVVGGGDSAVDFALMLEGVAESVTLIHRRDQFRAHEESVRQLHESSVHVKVFYELKSIHGGSNIERVTILQNKTKQMEDLQIDCIISALGFSASLGPILNWGLEIEDNAIVVNTKMETNIPGIYAAGDIVTYAGKIKLIATGFGEAPTAVNNAKMFIDPTSKLHPGHSSSMKL